MALPQLLPRPRRLDLSGAGCARDASCLAQQEPSLPDQGYTLTVSPRGVELRYADAAGRRYGEETLHRKYPLHLCPLMVRLRLVYQ